jgi:hypothetical protein
MASRASYGRGEVWLSAQTVFIGVEYRLYIDFRQRRHEAKVFLCLLPAMQVLSAMASVGFPCVVGQRTDTLVQVPRNSHSIRVHAGHRIVANIMQVSFSC